jgi:Tfp pilus assembly PilM family ATPase
VTETLGISFSAQQCHALSLIQNKTSFAYKNARSLAHEFENFSALPIIAKKLRSGLSKKTRVIVGISSQHIMMREFTLDATLSDADIIAFLESRAVQLFGHDSEQLCLDYEIQSIIEKNKQTINVIAAHQTMINSLQNAFAAEKIFIHAIDIDVCAIARARSHQLSHDFLSSNEMNEYTAAAGLCLWRST